MNFFSKLLNSGVTEAQDNEQNQKIRLSNGIAIYFIFMVVVYIIISIYLMPQILSFVLVSGVLYLAVPWLNKLGNYNLARFIAAINPAVVSFFIHISTISENESPIAGNFIIQISFTLLPWILFDHKEKILLFSAFFITICSILMVRLANEWVEPTEINTIARSVYLEYIFIVTACFIVGVTLYILQSFSMATQLKNKELKNEAFQRNLELEQNERKLNDYIKEIESSRIEEKQREWANVGLANFADILRQHNELSKTYDALISNLVKYLNVVQGGLYTVEEDSDGIIFLELKACYAYDRKKFREKIIRVGEGLIGQCYLEKDVMLLTEVPKDYISITSGLGDETPRCIVIVPFMVNEEVFALLELASFHTIASHEINFLKKVGENIASTISSLKINEKTKELLAKSIQQTEEMRAQEEEMRQNMEELNATQEEMQRKEKERLLLLEQAQQKELELIQVIKNQELIIDNLKSSIS